MMNTLKKDLIEESKALKNVIKEEFQSIVKKEKENKEKDKLIQSKPEKTEEQPTIEVEWDDDW